MKIKFLAVLKGLASKEEEELELKRPVTLNELVKKVAERQGEAFRRRFFRPRRGMA